MNKNDALVAEMQGIVRQAAEPRPPVDSSKGAIRRAAAALGLTYRRARSFWYGTTDHVRVTEAEAVRLRAERVRLQRARLARLERELAELRAELRRQDAQAAAGRSADEADGVAAPYGQAAAP